MKIRIVKHFDISINDDYTNVDLYIEEMLVESWGDWYHDKGDIKARAFAEGVAWAVRNYNGPDDTAEIITESVVDDY